ncbi:MAG: YihY/virulence factor BrkB family protein [Candidatus Fimisoma sp.]|nr:YihY/virulence factor BrkB family protein [Bacillota bacterium]MDY4747396.1 YihY/virulence factor BrkB family protein [Candidatus Fimisoma sp.]
MKQKAKDAGRRFKKMFLMMLDQFQDPFYQGVAAQIAFSLFLSIVPILILLSQLLGLFSLSLNEVKEWIGENMTVEGADSLLSMLQYSPSGVNSIFLAITALWAASRAQFAMLRVANYTLTDGRITGQSYIKDRLKSVKTILITIFTLGFSLVVLVYGELLLKLIFGAVIGEDISETAWAFIRWPIGMALYFLMISYNYYLLPTERVRYRDILPGSIFAAVGFLVVTYVYTIYTGISSNYDILYGSFSNMVVLMFWFWFLAWVMCLGISFNRVWWATRKNNRIPISDEAKERRKPLNIF